MHQGLVLAGIHMPPSAGLGVVAPSLLMTNGAMQRHAAVVAEVDMNRVGIEFYMFDKPGIGNAEDTFIKGNFVHRLK